MSKYTKYTEEQISKALDLYENTDKSVKEIAEITGLPHNYISKYAKKRGIPLRQPREYKYERKCQYCHRVIPLMEVRFCPYCGKDVRTSEEILKFNVRRLYQYGQHLPSCDRDTYKEIIDSMVAYLSKKMREQ